MQTNINITRALVETPDGVLSIHQISQKLKLPYGTAYNRIHALHKLGVVQMLHQGKAKLCAMNPDNPMTASLLALGSSQLTDAYIKRSSEIGSLFKKIRKAVIESNSHCLSSAILLTPESLAEIIDSPQSLTVDSDGVYSTTLDFFFVKHNDDFDEQKTETEISSLLPPDAPVGITSMTVDRETLLGMLNEEENEAGLAAYSMLHNGIILFGFENFYTTILEAFARKLSSYLYVF